MWEKFLSCWATVFIGYPKTIHLDQESAFDKQDLRTLASGAGVVLHFSGVESHKYIGVGYKYHDPL